jgi:hypothetical protein
VTVASAVEGGGSVAIVVYAPYAPQLPAERVASARWSRSAAVSTPLPASAPSASVSATEVAVR